MVAPVIHHTMPYGVIQCHTVSYVVHSAPYEQAPREGRTFAQREDAHRPRRARDLRAARRGGWAVTTTTLRDDDDDDLLCRSLW